MAWRGHILCRQLRYVYRAVTPATVATATTTTGRIREAQQRLLHVGERASLTKAFSARDVAVFAELTGDVNPIHLDPSYAKTTSFESPIVHGVLINGLISAVLGTKLPGAASYFCTRKSASRPALCREEVLAEAEVKKIKMSFALISVSCSVKDKVVMEGEVMVMVPEAKRRE